MIDAYIRMSTADRSLVLRATGHAGYADAGQDIVCAGASTLAYTLAEVVSAAYQAGWVGDDCVVKVEDASDVEVSCVADSEDNFGELIRAYLVIATGYRLLSLTYPEYVKFNAEIKA